MNHEELSRVVIEQLRATRQKAGQDAGDTIDGNLDLTSLEIVRLLVALEEHLDTEIDETAIMNARLETVDDVVALLRKSLALSATGTSE